jgi:arylsulfatase
MTADVELTNDKTNGVIIAQAGRFGGWSLYMKDGKVHHDYNYFGLEHTNIASSKSVATGKHIIKYEFVYDGGKPGAGGQCILYVDDQKVAEGHIPKTQPYAYSADEGVDVGMDNETNVTNDYKEGDNHFTGTIRKITIDVK